MHLTDTRSGSIKFIKRPMKGIAEWLLASGFNPLAKPRHTIHQGSSSSNYISHGFNSYNNIFFRQAKCEKAPARRLEGLRRKVTATKINSSLLTVK